MRFFVCLLACLLAVPAFAERIVLVNESLDEVLSLLERHSGRTVLRAPDLPPVRVNFTGPENLGQADTVAALEGLLSVSGVAVVPHGRRFFRAVPLTVAVQEIPPVYTAPVSSLSASSRTVARVFTLKHASASALQMALLPLVNPARGSSLVALQSANALLLVAPLSAVQEAEKIVSAADVDRREKLVSELVGLRHADAVEVVKLFSQVSTTATTPTPQTGQSLDEQPLHVFSRFFKVQADTRSNGVVAFGTAGDVERVRALVAQVDVPLPQVGIEAVIVEVTLQGQESSGLATLGLGYNSGFTFSTSAASASSLETPFSLTGRIGHGFSLSGIFRQSERDSRVKILSAPLISTSHNRPASIFVGQTRPVITSSQTSAENTSTRSAVAQQEIGLKLQVTPRIGIDGSVEMVVVQTSENIAGNVSIDGNEQPIIAKREASSYLTAKTGETVVLAGMQSRQETASNGGVWLLKDLPLVGHWFRPSTRENERTELIVFLRPHVVGVGLAAPAGHELTPGELAALQALRK